MQISSTLEYIISILPYAKHLAQERNAHFFLSLWTIVLCVDIANMHHNYVMLNPVNLHINIITKPRICLFHNFSFIQNCPTQNFILASVLHQGDIARVIFKTQIIFATTKRSGSLLACSVRWIILTSVHYGLHWLPGCFWMQFKVLPLIYEAVYILSQKLFILKSPTVGSLKQGTIVEAACSIIQS